MMGYTTRFSGQFTIEPPLSPEQIDHLNSYYEEDKFRQNGLPNSYCQWLVSADSKVAWNGGEKFYDYCEWLTVFVNDVISFGSELKGMVSYQGEDAKDSGIILIQNDEVYKLSTKNIATEFFELVPKNDVDISRFKIKPFDRGNGGQIGWT